MDSTATPEPALSEIRRRLRADWGLKFGGVTAFIAVFFAGYFLALRFPLMPVTAMPVTALDRAIPFQPATLILYFSLWLYVSLPSALMSDRVELLAHARSAAALGLVGLGIFFFWPTAVPPGAGASAAEMAGFAWLKNVDAAGNACPSLHAAFAVFGGLSLDRIVREMRLPKAVRVVSGCWGLGIVYSTLSTKQHVVIDVVAGALLGLAAGLIRPRGAAAKAGIPAAR